MFIKNVKLKIKKIFSFNKNSDNLTQDEIDYMLKKLDELQGK